MEGPGLRAFQVPAVQVIDSRVGKGDQKDCGRIHVPAYGQVLYQALDRFRLSASRTRKDKRLVFITDNGFRLGIIEFPEEISMFALFRFDIFEVGFLESAFKIEEDIQLFRALGVFPRQRIFQPAQLFDPPRVFFFYSSYLGNGVIPAGIQKLFNFSKDPVQQKAEFSFRIPLLEYGSRGNSRQKKNKNSPDPFHAMKTPYTLLYPQYPPVPLFSLVCILLRAPENRQKIRKELV